MNFNDYEDGVDLGHERNEINEREEAHMRRQRVHESNQNCEILFSGCVALYLVASMIFGKDEANCGDFMTWLKWSLLFYVADLILGMN